MKMPTIVGIFIFISREIFMLSGFEVEKKVYNLVARLPVIRRRLHIDTIYKNKTHSYNYLFTGTSYYRDSVYSLSETLHMFTNRTFGTNMSNDLPVTKVLY